MIILTLRTDKLEAEIALYDDEINIARLSWQAHRKLAETLHEKIKGMLSDQNLAFKDLRGVVIYKGPGSFTGLRIGFSVANALADSISIPIVSVEGDDWTLNGVRKILQRDNDIIALPEYGSPAKTTIAKK